jgi:hypothetical protein
MAAKKSLFGEEPSEEDYRRADEFIRWANSRDGISPERRQALREFRKQIARTYQAERAKEP